MKDSNMQDASILDKLRAGEFSPLNRTISESEPIQHNFDFLIRAISLTFIRKQLWHKVASELTYFEMRTSYILRPRNGDAPLCSFPLALLLATPAHEVPTFTFKYPILVPKLLIVDLLYSGESCEPIFTLIGDEDRYR